MKMTKQNDNRVEVFIPKGYATEEPNFFVGINGQSYLLPRGKRSLVPDFVAAEIRRAELAQQARDARSAALADSGA